MAESWSGGCQCGAVRYEVDPAAVATLYCCHCRECQRQSGSAFGMSLIVARGGFRLARGELKVWQRSTDRGGVNRGHFCPGCGVRIFHDGGADSAEISVKAGTLDDTGRLAPVGHLWTRRAQPWVSLSAEPLRYESQPESRAALCDAYRAAAP